MNEVELAKKKARLEVQIAEKKRELEKLQEEKKQLAGGGKKWWQGW